MELHTGDVAALHDRREWLAVSGHRDGIAGNGCDETVREIHLRAVNDAIDDGTFVLEVERVPPDVWDFYRCRGQPVPSSAEQAEPPKVGRFLAALEQPLHAEADAKQRT